MCCTLLKYSKMIEKNISIIFLRKIVMKIIYYSEVIMENNYISITMATDDNYAEIMVVSIVSILENNQNEKFLFHIIDAGIKNKNVEKIKNITLKYKNINIDFVDFSEIEKKLSSIIKVTIPPLPLITYARLYIADYIKDDRTLYIDCDTVCVSSIGKFYSIDLTDEEIIAGVQDTVSEEIKEKIGLDIKDKYINAGIILIDLKKWREQDYTNKAIEFIKKYHGMVMHNDQGVINGLFKGHVKIIDMKYNVMTPAFMITRDTILDYFAMSSYYSEQEILDAKKNPVFLHFVRFTTSRPWEKGCRHPYRDKFVQMWEKAGLGDVPQIEYSVPLVYRIGFWILENFKFSTYRKYISLVGKLIEVKKVKRG